MLWAWIQQASMDLKTGPSFLLLLFVFEELASSAIVVLWQGVLLSYS